MFFIQKSLIYETVYIFHPKILHLWNHRYFSPKNPSSMELLIFFTQISLIHRIIDVPHPNISSMKPSTFSKQRNNLEKLSLIELARNPNNDTPLPYHIPTRHHPVSLKPSYEVNTGTLLTFSPIHEPLVYRAIDACCAVGDFHKPTGDSASPLSD